MTQKIVTIQNLIKRYGTQDILRGVNLEVDKGEVVVIDENFGVRITEIVSPHERSDSLFSD